jgi:hypothetical protein
VGFRPVYVFDISQTEREELPKLHEISGNVRRNLARLVPFVTNRGITFGYSEEIAPARGISYGGKIQLLPDMSEAEQFTTLVHNHGLLTDFCSPQFRADDQEAPQHVTCKMAFVSEESSCRSLMA